MQCQSYFPVYHSQYDFNVDGNGNGNGGGFPMYNGNATIPSRHYNEYVASLPLSRGPPFPYKEVFRQTMLLHEHTFKDQVHELHRLYRRQKELMGEIKSKEMYMNSLHIEDQSSNSSSARNGQNVLHNLPFLKFHCTPSTGRDHIQRSLSSRKEPKPLVSPVASQNGGTLHDLDFVESKGKKIRGKLLDLELPAEVYIDSDEEDTLQATPPTTFSRNKRAKVVVEYEVKPSAANISLYSVLQGELPNPRSSSQISTNLADLNEPLAMSCLEDKGEEKITNFRLEISEISHDLFNSENSIPDGAADRLIVTSLAQSDIAKSEVCLASSGRKPAYNLGLNPPVVQALPSLNSQLLSTRGAKNSGRQKVLIKNVDASEWCNPNLRVTKSSKNSCSESKQFETSACFVSAQNRDCDYIDLNFVAISNPEYTTSSSKFTEDETMKSSKRLRMIDINLPFDLTTYDETHDLVGHDYESSGQLNLNFCLNDDALPPKSSSMNQTRLEIDLEAPISPEVEGCPPTRCCSEQNQPEEGCEALVELAKIAAEAIVSISSSHCGSCHESMVLQKCEPSESCNLEWFAGLVSSLFIDVDNDFEMMSCKDTCVVDDYEAMTLELTEMNVDDYWCKSSVQISSESCSMLLPCQTSKGRTRRSKRKDFQREVLPSLASLSRYEVTEDIQMIEGLMEAAGTPWQLSRTRRTCRMGRKSRLAKHQTSANEVPELVAIMSWGKVNRRSRGRRSPASPTVLLKWLEFDV